MAKEFAAPSHVIEIPIEYYRAFAEDSARAWQAHGSFGHSSSSSFFENPLKIYQMVDDRPNPFDNDSFQFADWFYCEDDLPRCMHIDLSKSRDAVGMSMWHISDWTDISVIREQDGHRILDRDRLPKFYCDFLLRIRPEEQGGQINYSLLRELIYEIDGRGYPLYLITFDRFGSIDFIQILQEKGFTVGNLSLDRTTSYPVLDLDKEDHVRNVRVATGKFAPISAWSVFKSAVNTNRVNIPRYEETDYTDPVIDDRIDGIDGLITQVQKEALHAIYDAEKVKIYEPANGSIDLLESCAGGVFNCANNFTFIEEESYDDARRRVADDKWRARTQWEYEEAEQAEKDLLARKQGTKKDKDKKKNYYDDSSFE